MKRIRSICIVLAVVCSGACGGSSVEGTYYNVENRNEYIVLKKENEFYLKADGMDLSGRYAIDGKTIILNPTGRTAARGVIQDNVIVDNDGTSWERK